MESRTDSVGRLSELRGEADLMYTLHEKIARAYEVPDYLASLPVFQRHQGVNARIASHSSCPSEARDWMVNLQERNMHEFWDTSFKWSVDEKKRELFDIGSRFLIATVSESPVGFVHFRFEQQSGEFVLFIMSVQIEPQFQRKRLGRFLVQATELVGLGLKVNSLMTFVLKANKRGMGFFQSLMYTPHKSSPEVLAPGREHKHVILYKPLKPRVLR
jgi:GNAT superfamily N-acetyltransferase